MQSRLDLLLCGAPQQTAYEIETECRTYFQLHCKAERFGFLLCRQGKRPVTLFGRKSADMFCSIFACIAAGRPHIPVEEILPKHRAEKIQKASGADLLILCGKELSSGLALEETTLSGLEAYGDRPEIPNDNRIAYLLFTSGSTGEPKGVPISYDNPFSSAGFTPCRRFLCLPRPRS